MVLSALFGKTKPGKLHQGIPIIEEFQRALLENVANVLGGGLENYSQRQEAIAKQRQGIGTMLDQLMLGASQGSLKLGQPLPKTEAMEQSDKAEAYLADWMKRANLTEQTARDALKVLIEDEEAVKNIQDLHGIGLDALTKVASPSWQWPIVELIKEVLKATTDPRHHANARTVGQAGAFGTTPAPSPAYGKSIGHALGIVGTSGMGYGGFGGHSSVGSPSGGYGMAAGAGT